tara:strand:- start:246 stop:3779 length:3534 start_codon:yes stop_codon:yes gene_type:complete
MAYLQKLLADAKKEERDTDITLSPTPTTTKRGAYTSSIIKTNTQDADDVAATVTYEAMKKDPAVREAAVRFAQDHLGYETIDPDDAISEFIEHFRSFNVNELTAGMDYNIVSGLATDAASTTNKDNARKAQQRLDDYTKLYQTYQALPGAFDAGGAPGAFLDYLEGIAKAPSTYIGIVPGIFTGGAATALTKAGATAGAQVAKEGVKQIIKRKLTSPVSELAKAAAANPVKTTVLTEATAGALQNIAQQKTEIEIGERDTFSKKELALMSTISGAPAALIPGLLKNLSGRQINKGAADLLDDAEKAIAAKNEKAVEAAEATFEGNIKLARDIDSQFRGPLDPEGVARGNRTKAQIGEQLGVTNEFVISLDPTRDKRIIAAGMEILEAGKVTYDPAKERFSDALGRAITQVDFGDEGLKSFKDTMKKYNLSSDDMLNVLVADLSRADASEAGALLGRRSAAKRKLIRRITDAGAADLFGLTEETTSTLKKLDDALASGDTRQVLQATGEVKEGITIRGIDQLRLSMMTSQTATTFRNLISGYSRVGFDIATKVLDRSMAQGASVVGKGKGKVKLFEATPNVDTFAVLSGLTNHVRSRALATLLQQGFQRRHQQLFRQLTDIADASGELKGARTSKMQHLARELNALNTLQDNMFKQASFFGELSRELNEAAARTKAINPAQDVSQFNLERIMRSGNFNEIFESTIKAGDEVVFDGKKVLDRAIDKSLYFTFQRSPSNPTAKAFVNAAHSLPFLTTSFVPFPRFVANALRFTYEYSPAYLVSGIRKSLAKDADNYEELAKGLVGSGFLAGAIAFRNSEYAGENWYEGKTMDGKTYDLRPFFPAAPYLFFADLITRKYKGEPLTGDRSITTEAIQALSGTQFRAGFGIYALDKAFKDITEEQSAEKAAEIAAQFTGNIINTFTIPFTSLQDTFNTFIAEDEARIVRDTDMQIKDTKDFLTLVARRSLARIPLNYKIEEYLAETLGVKQSEYYESGTRAEKLRRIAPITRQTMGILLQERKNFFEKEISRLKLPRSVINARTGVPEADMMLDASYGEYITNYVVPRMETEGYKKLEDAQKKVFIMELISDYKSDIKEAVEQNAKETAEARFGFNPFELKAFEKFANDRRTAPFAQKAIEMYEERYGKDEPKDYEVILKIAKMLRDRRKFSRSIGSDEFYGN